MTFKKTYFAFLLLSLFLVKQGRSMLSINEETQIIYSNIHNDYSFKLKKISDSIIEIEYKNQDNIQKKEISISGDIICTRPYLHKNTLICYIFNTKFSQLYAIKIKIKNSKITTKEAKNHAIEIHHSILEITIINDKKKNKKYVFQKAENDWRKRFTLNNKTYTSFGNKNYYIYFIYTSDLCFPKEIYILNIKNEKIPFDFNTKNKFQTYCSAKEDSLFLSNKNSLFIIDSENWIKTLYNFKNLDNNPAYITKECLMGAYSKQDQTVTTLFSMENFNDYVFHLDTPHKKNIHLIPHDLHPLYVEAENGLSFLLSHNKNHLALHLVLIENPEQIYIFFIPFEQLSIQYINPEHPPIVDYIKIDVEQKKACIHLNCCNEHKDIYYFNIHMLKNNPALLIEHKLSKK